MIGNLRTTVSTMAENEPPANPAPRFWLRLVVYGVLTLLAAFQVVFGLDLLTTGHDSDNLESTLAYVAAWPLYDGLGTLYGPYGLANMRVLIQAPLYYRLTELGAAPLVFMKIHVVNACLVVGRAISTLSYLGVLVLVHRLARIDGASRRAGTIAVLAVLSSAVVARTPFTLRPDMFGIFLQLLGGYLVLRVIWIQGPPTRAIVWAYVSFALAFCVKQHLVATGVGCTFLLIRFWRSAGPWRRPIERAWLIAPIIAASYYLAEDVVSEGRAFTAVFVLPGAIRALATSKWFNVIGLFFSTIVLSSPLVILAAASAWAAPRPEAQRRLDRAFWLLLLLEVATFAFISYGNEGAWINYAIPSVIYGSILLGRSLSRLLEFRISTMRSVAVGVAAILAFLPGLFFGVRSLLTVALHRRELIALLTDLQLRGVDSRSIYFVGLPELNRFYGHSEWVHDEWLYGRFERIKAAPPRAVWLLPALTTGPVRVVVIPVNPPFAFPLDPPVIPGLTAPLPALGFQFAYQVGRFKVWEKRKSPAPGMLPPR